MTTATSRAGSRISGRGCGPRSPCRSTSTAGCGGRSPWGPGEGPLPPDTEQRMTEFTDLVATAVANAQNRAALEASRDELARLLAEQAALRRVATLVARGIDPGEIFSAVAEEIRRLLDADSVGIGRFELDGTAVVVSGAVTGNSRTRRRPGRAWNSATTLPRRWCGGPAAPPRSTRTSGAACRTRPPTACASWASGRRWRARSSSKAACGAWWSRLTRRGPFPSGTAEPHGGLHRARRDGRRERREPGRAGRLAGADRRRHRSRPGGGSSGTCTTGPSSGWSRSAWSCACAQGMVPAGLAELEAEIGRVADELNGVVEDLREIARGIHPAILSEGGLGPALRTLARRAAIAVELDLAAIGRLPEPVEVAAYYVCLRSAHQRDPARARVGGLGRRGSLGRRLRLRSATTAPAAPTRPGLWAGRAARPCRGAGRHVRDHSPAGAGTTLSCELPLPAPAADTGPAHRHQLRDDSGRCAVAPGVAGPPSTESAVIPAGR